MVYVSTKVHEADHSIDQREGAARVTAFRRPRALGAAGKSHACTWEVLHRVCQGFRFVSVRDLSFPIEIQNLGTLNPENQVS